MQMKAAAEMRRRRKEEELPICERPSAEHPHEKEYSLGAQTGDWNCTHCGASFTDAEVREFQRGLG